MESDASNFLPPNDSDSFGIEKVVDCRIGEDGRQMYKVRWECTWEPAENLVGCQHVIDEFWSLINKVKGYEAKLHSEISLKQARIQNGTNFGELGGLSKEVVHEVQDLISRTTATSVSSSRLQSPSNMLSSINPWNNTMDTGLGQSCTNYKNYTNLPLDQKKYFPTSSISEVKPDVKPPDMEELQSWMNGSKSATSISNSTLKYVENFENPYVKIVVVCKKCNKEQSLKNASNWKQHYLTHVSDTEKPHKCTLCPKAFVTSTHLKRHMKNHQNKNGNQTTKLET